MGSQSHKAALTAAFSRRVGKGSLIPSAQVQESLVASVTPTLPNIFSPINPAILDNVLGISSTDSLYTAIADEFKPRLEASIFSGDRLPSGNQIYSGVALCTRALIPLASLKNRLLDLGTFSVLTKYIGTLRRDKYLIGLAHSSYTLALGEFRQILNDMSSRAPSQQRSDSMLQVILCVCLTLQLFEMIDQDQPGAGLDVHINGALSIIQITDPEVYKRRHLRYIFSGWRNTVIAMALRRRRPILLAEPLWLSVPFENTEKTRVERLHDLALELPSLLSRSDALQRSSKSVSTGRSVNELIQNYFELKNRLRQWFVDFKSEDIERCYWFADNIGPGAQPISEFDPVCIPVFPAQFRLRFRNGPTAGLLCQYWGYQLQLLMGVLDVSSIERIQDDSDNPTKDRSGLEMNVIQSEADELAGLVLQTIPYLSCCLEGRIAAQGPFAIVIRYLERSRRTTGVRSISEYAALWQLLTAQ